MLFKRRYMKIQCTPTPPKKKKEIWTGFDYLRKMLKCFEKIKIQYIPQNSEWYYSQIGLLELSC
uniref:Uncharacterized protein n=1 Tax=Nelumbo nucifera TaxID=4432 RepID=A0A822YCF0_NELNU|nr:TPA_asm: hypothetical protein HUJ06_010645 [Nelumbo nucifera]